MSSIDVVVKATTNQEIKPVKVAVSQETAPVKVTVEQDAKPLQVRTYVGGVTNTSLEAYVLELSNEVARLSALKQDLLEIADSYDPIENKIATIASITNRIIVLKSEIDGSIFNLTAALNTLIGNDAGKSARKITQEEIAAQLVSGGESFDSLKEIAEWLKDHPEDVGEMNAKINEAIATANEAKTTAEAIMSIANRALDIATVAREESSNAKDKAESAIKSVQAETNRAQEAETFLNNSKQEKLVSGTNIKTIGGKSILGAGNITKADLGLGNVDNTSDLNKPVSTLQQSAINTAKAEAEKSANAYTDKEIEKLSQSQQSNLSFDGIYNENTNKVATQETVTNGILAHNVSKNAHNDIRLLIEGLSTRLNALADSDDATLDQMSEIVAYIKANKLLIESITTNKVNVSDIVNNLTTNVANKPLSASQGVALKGLIDTLSKDKLNASDLESAITTALAQAKASGEFNGKNGISATHSWDGTVLTVTSASGTSSADLKGEHGDSGVYVGSGEMPDGYNVQIDPDGGDSMDLIVQSVISALPKYNGEVIEE